MAKKKKQFLKNPSKKDPPRSSRRPERPSPGVETSKPIEGLVKRHPDGFGFLIPTDRSFPDVYLPRHTMTGVMTQDLVLVRVEPERGGERFRGEILKVTKRGLTQVVGALEKFNERFAVLKDEALSWGQDLRIPWEATRGAKIGELVAVEITDYPSERQAFLGRVRSIIGSRAEPLNDIPRIVHGQQIPYEFPKEVLEEAKVLPPEPLPSDSKKRVDLRLKPLITIDGSTAKDFDDAILVEREANKYRLIVAIADVAHYVRPESPMDQEAYLRGTSVYFPNTVIPMIPMELSHGLCSLMPDVPRLCLVAEMVFDHRGNRLEKKFYEGLMQSWARVTYGEAQEVIDGVQVERLARVKSNILAAADLAKILLEKRFSEGSLELEIPETTLQIDSAGVPTDVLRSERLFSHRLIEEMMLAANVAVAEFFEERKTQALFRVHDRPNPTALSQLEKFLESFGGKPNFDGGLLQKRITQALREFEGRPEGQILNILTLRSMAQAKYQPENHGHFGLGFTHYTHFTSPIRRYPDLMVHRCLKNLLRTDLTKLPELNDLRTAGTHLSACEQRAAKAERQLMSIKKARFMEKHVGAEFIGLISSVVRFGVFVLLREFDIDGLVKLEDLAKEKLEYDENRLVLYSPRSGKKYCIGDEIRVCVESVDSVLGQINFVLAERPAKEKSTADRSVHFGNQKKLEVSSRENAYDKSGEGGRPSPRRPRAQDLFVASSRRMGFGMKKAEPTALKTQDGQQKPKKNEEERNGRRSEYEPSGKNPQERSKTKDHRRRLRKTRVSRARKKT